ncbi:MAG: SCO6745 family protein [Acidimicrobiales bacterium]
MGPTPTLARRFWEAVEPIHAIVYFAPKPADAARRIGLRGFWMGYFAGRMAPLGPVPPESVAAMAYGFAPAMVARAIPDAWRFADPTVVLDARITSAADALCHSLDPAAIASLTELSDLLWEAVAGCRFEGRPLAAAWSRVPRPDDRVASAWLAATVLREHRGDGHVLAAVAGGLRGLDATLTFVATRAITREVIQPSRGWSDDDWEQSLRRLQAKGILDRDGRLTKTGGALRRDVEDLTDRLAAAPVERLGKTGVERAIALATPVSRHLIDSGVIPVPNPIGAPRP